MKVISACTKCKKEFNINENLLGRKALCNNCNEIFTLSLTVLNPDIELVNSEIIEEAIENTNKSEELFTQQSDNYTQDEGKQDTNPSINADQVAFVKSEDYLASSTQLNNIKSTEKINIQESLDTEVFKYDNDNVVIPDVSNSPKITIETNNKSKDVKNKGKKYIKRDLIYIFIIIILIALLGYCYFFHKTEFITIFSDNSALDYLKQIQKYLMDLYQG